MDARRGVGPGRPVPILGLYHRVDALPRAKRGELQGRCQRKTDSAHWRIPPSLHSGALNGLGGGPDTLPVPVFNSGRGPQR